MALVALLLVGLVTLLAGGSHALDDLQARQDRARVEAVIERQRQSLIAGLTTVTVWDETYRELRPGGSQAWADENVGRYLADNWGRAWVVAIDGDGRPFAAWRGAERTDPKAQRSYLDASQALIEEVRAAERRRGWRQAGQAATPALADTAGGVVRVGKTYYIVAASTVSPEDPGKWRVRGSRVVVLCAERLDGDPFAELRELGFKGLRLGSAFRGPAMALLHDPAGTAIGAIAWSPQRPSLKVLAEAAPLLACVLLALCAVTVALGWQIVRVVRQLSVHERALNETLRQLAEARDRAEEANVARSRFIANMSHEIRTPLNGVLGMAQVLARSDLKPGDREKVDVIRSSGEGLLSLLNDVLDLSKAEAGRMELDPQPFDLARQVAAATQGFAVLAEQKGVDMHVDVTPEAQGMWMGDGNRLRQVLANLASNAVKFTAEGEVRVAVRRTAEGLACAVLDTGPGIAPDLLPRLFSPFTQADATTTRKFGGTGLGLAIARELVELMGGRISVTSEAGKGATFAFSLPMTWLEPPRDGVDEDEDEAGVPAGLRILAAEDNATNRLLLAAMLEPLGFHLTLACDGHEAVAAFLGERFDLVLMDVQMPRLNGIDAAREIRAAEARRGGAPTPILAVSANVMDAQVESYLAAGMDGFVAKPIELPALLAAIEQILAARVGEGERLPAHA